MIEEAVHESRRIERCKLMQHAVGKAPLREPRGSDGSRGKQNSKAAGADAVEERHHGKNLADACTMHPDKRTERPPFARDSAPLGDARGIFLFAPEPSLHPPSREW